MDAKQSAANAVERILVGKSYRRRLTSWYPQSMGLTRVRTLIHHMRALQRCCLMLFPSCFVPLKAWRKASSMWVLVKRGRDRVACKCKSPSGHYE